MRDLWKDHEQLIGLQVHKCTGKVQVYLSVAEEIELFTLLMKMQAGITPERNERRMADPQEIV
jgi:hypothetical protein